MKISIALTTYNRFGMLQLAYSEIINDPRVDEVVIVDDHSMPRYQHILSLLEETNHKIRVHINQSNLGMARNKEKAISMCKNPCVVILDSDNVLPLSYLDALEKVLPKEPSMRIYMPAFARPNFDYRQFSGYVFDKRNVLEYANNDLFWTMLNTCNYVVPRDHYSQVFQYNPEIKETDTLYFAYLWLKAGGSMLVVPGMEYEHKVHEGSGWLKNAQYNIDMHNKLKTQILQICQ